MKDVRAPKIGYSSEAKKDYRKQVWDSILESVGGGGNILILPSKDGEEIDYLISLGFPQSRIVCIDENPALIATAPWRKKYKSIRAYGCKVSQAGARLRKAKITIQAANIDLCNNFSEELVHEVSTFLATAPIDNEFCFSVTVSKGRESSAVNYLMNMLMQSGKWQTSEYNSLSEKRIACLMRIASSHIPINSIVKIAGEGSYIHHKTPMAWASFLIINTSESSLIKQMYEKARFERKLHLSSQFNFCNGEYLAASECDNWFRLVSNSSLSDIKKHYKILYGFINRVLSGEEDYAYMYAKLSIKEHEEIVDMYENIMSGAIDYDSGLCNINRTLEGFGRDYKNTEGSKRDIELYELIKYKFG